MRFHRLRICENVINSLQVRPVNSQKGKVWKAWSYAQFDLWWCMCGSRLELVKKWVANSHVFPKSCIPISPILDKITQPFHLFQQKITSRKSFHMFFWFQLFLIVDQFYWIDGLFEAIILSKNAKRPVEFKNSIKKPSW